MMATTLKYNFVTSNEESGILTVGFADAQFNTQEYLLFQNRLDSDGEDSEIYIERDDQSQGTYGGIQRFILRLNHALLLLGSKTAEVINTDQEVYILFSATNEHFQQLKSGFEVVFAGKQILEVRQ